MQPVSYFDALIYNKYCQNVALIIETKITKKELLFFYHIYFAHYIYVYEHVTLCNNNNNNKKSTWLFTWRGKKKKQATCNT